MLERIDIKKFLMLENGNIIWLNGEDVSQQIRTPKYLLRLLRFLQFPMSDIKW